MQASSPRRKSEGQIFLPLSSQPPFRLSAFFPYHRTYAIQPFSYTELAPGTTDWNDVYRTDPDPEHPLKRGRQLNVMLTGDEYEMLCRAAFKLGIARSAWVRERVYALLCRSYADELSPLTDASIRDNATMLLKELKTKDAGR